MIPPWALAVDPFLGLQSMCSAFIRSAWPVMLSFPVSAGNETLVLSVPFCWFLSKREPLEKAYIIFMSFIYLFVVHHHALFLKSTDGLLLYTLGRIGQRSLSTDLSAICKRATQVTNTKKVFGQNCPFNKKHDDETP